MPVPNVQAERRAADHVARVRTRARRELCGDRSDHRLKVVENGGLPALARAERDGQLARDVERPAFGFDCAHLPARDQTLQCLPTRDGFEMAELADCCGMKR